MDKSLLAKLHDILKLTGDSNKHYCPEWCDEFNELVPEIKKLLKHHCVSRYWTPAHKPGCNPFSVDREMLCIHLADVKAATISRKLRTTDYKSHKTFRIWKDAKKSDDILKKEKDEFSQYDNVLKELKDSSDLERLYKRFENEFITRSEDARRSPFASLQTHNELTALWFVFFLNNAVPFGIPELIDNKNTLRKIRYAFSKKRIAVVRISLKVNTKLSRLRDAKLIKDIPKILENMGKKLNGSLIYSLPEEILVITLPEEAVNIEQKAKELLGNRTNYYFEITSVETVLSNKEFLHKYNEIFGDYRNNIYPSLEKEIGIVEGNDASHRAIICDMCQMAPASIIYPQEVYGSTGVEPVEEFLCKGCLDIRKEADKAMNLAKWEDEDDAGVAFFKITLDMPELIRLLKEMFKAVFGFKDVFDEDLGFSIIKEFLLDYSRFLELFRKRVLSYEEYGKESNHETVLDNLFCIKIKKDSDVKPLVNEYIKLLSSDDYFMKMADFAIKNNKILPIKISVTISNVKYPFMEHWQTLNNPKEDINIYAVPHTKLETSINKYKYLMDAGIEDKKISSALHRLAYIEERTKNPFLVKVTMLDMKNDLKGLARYLISTNELSIKETLAYYKLMKD